MKATHAKNCCQHHQTDEPTTHEALRRARQTNDSGRGSRVDVLDVVLLEDAKVHSPAIRQSTQRCATRHDDPTVSAVRVSMPLLFLFGTTALLAVVTVTFGAVLLEHNDRSLDFHFLDFHVR